MDMLDGFVQLQEHLEFGCRLVESVTVNLDLVL